MPKSSSASRTPRALRFSQQVDGVVEVLDEQTFGDLEDQRTWIHLRSVEDAGHDRAEVRAHQLSGRNVDGQIQRHAGLGPQPLAASKTAALEHPRAELADEAALLGDRHHRHGRHVAPDRVVPAQQRLDAGNRSVATAHDRLIRKVESSLGERRTQVDLEAVAVGCHQRLAQIDDLVTAATSALGLVHRDVRLDDELVGDVLARVRRRPCRRSR